MYVMYVIGGGCAGGGVVLALRAVSTQVLARKLKLFLTLVGLLYTCTVRMYCTEYFFWLDPIQVRYRILCIARSTRLHKSAM